MAFPSFRGGPPEKLSIIIPACNEERVLGRCLASIQDALGSSAPAHLETEIIVADNGSMDATASIAQAMGARVVHEPHRQISRARNAGACGATGDWYLFIDADSILHPVSLTDMLDHIATRSLVGGGSIIGLDGIGLGIRIAEGLWNGIARSFHLAAGSFFFCRSDAFHDLGGFSEELYAGEELALGRALKRWGRSRGLDFVLLTRQAHVSSARKFALYSRAERLLVVLRVLWSPRRALRHREGLEIFYDGRR